MLVNVPRLVTAYYAEHPDPSVAAERVAFGTSGHRGSAFERTFNEAHILAITQAICSYRQAHGIDGPLFMGMDTHALSEPAFASALEVLAANGVEVMIDRDARLYADAGHLARHPSATTVAADPGWRTGSSSRLRTTRLKTAASNTTRRRAARPTPSVTGWIEQTANALLAEGLRAVRRMPYERARRAASTHLHDYITPYVDDLAGVIDMDGHPQRRRANRRGSARRRRRALLGTDHRAVRNRRDRGERARSIRRSAS